MGKMKENQVKMQASKARKDQAKLLESQSRDQIRLRQDVARMQGTASRNGGWMGPNDSKNKQPSRVEPNNIAQAEPAERAGPGAHRMFNKLAARQTSVTSPPERNNGELSPDLYPAKQKAIALHLAREQTSCISPQPIAHGETILHTTVVGSQVEYTCHKNYYLIGQAIRTCLSTSDWSGSEPQCQLATSKCKCT